MTATPARSSLASPDPAQPDPSETGVQVRNVAFTLLSVAIVILLLQYMQPVLLPLVLGGLLFYALDPGVDCLQTLHVPRAFGAALMLLVVIVGCGVLFYSLQGQARTVIDQLPAASRTLTQSLRNVPGAEPGAMEKVQKAADELKGTEAVSTPAGKFDARRVRRAREDAKRTSEFWLAESLGWLPVRVTYSDSDGERIELKLVRTQRRAR